MNEKLETVQQVVTDADMEKCLKLLANVISWRTHPSQANTIIRRQDAIDWLAKLHGPGGADWLPDALYWLHQVASDYQVLASAWVQK